MTVRRGVITLLGITLLTIPALSQGQKAPFDGRAAFGYVKALSADAMAGRKSGEAGGQMATDYVAGKLKEWGLEPAGANGTWFQDMTFEYFEVEQGAALAFTAHNRTREFVYGEDWRQYRYSGSGSIAAGVVFVGYGISAPAKGYDDYAGVDVKDRLALFAVETPPRLEGTLKDEARIENRVKAAREHGAKGVVTFRSDRQPSPMFFEGELKSASYKADFPIVSVESKVVDFLFKWQKADPRFFFQQIDQTGKPQSCDMGVQALVNLQVVFDGKRPAQNVLAKIPGSDPALGGEYVIVGAHMDHLGVDMTGDILNGADDNASGTAVVLEAARALKASHFRPKRTVVFALWAAEEEGLLGSKYYTEHPIYPLEKTVATINLDMEGHGTGKVRVGGKYFAPETWDVLMASLPKAVLDDTVPNRGGPGGSDHTHFLYNGVPAFMVSTDGPHFKTNRVGDVIGLIQPDILQKSGDFVVAALQVLSTDPRVAVLPSRQEMFHWRYTTILNHRATSLDAAILEHKDVRDPDVDVQLVTVADKAASKGDALRLDVMKALMSARDRVAQTQGLVLAGGAPAPGMAMMGPAGPSKTTLLLGLEGIEPLRGDTRWAAAFAQQGLRYVAIDRTSGLFANGALTTEGKKTVEAIGDGNLLLVAKGLGAAEAKALLLATRRPVVLYSSTVLDPEVVALIKKTESTVGLALGKDEAPAAYFRRLDAARVAVGVDAVAIVSEASLWQAPGRTQMLALFGEMLKALYSPADLQNLTSGSFMRALNRARAGSRRRSRDR